MFAWILSEREREGERVLLALSLRKGSLCVALIFIVRKSFSGTFCSPNTLFEISSVLHPITA